MKHLRVVSVAVLMLIMGSALQALMIEIPPRDLADGSDLIVSGIVTDVTSYWNSDQTAIYSDVTLVINQVEKGADVQRVVVRIPGGEVGDVGMAVEDIPFFEIGDQVRLHLVKTPEPGVYEIFGALQGVSNEMDAPPLKYYSYSGYHRDPATCNYYINSLVPEDWISAIQAGDLAWDEAGSRFRFNYIGTTTRTGPTYDGYNVVFLSNLGGNGVLARNTFWYNRKTKIVYENDIEFNTYYPWSTGGDANSYDVQNIATHELGHCLVLNDLYKDYQSEMTMYGYAAIGETKKRSLEFGDKDGIIYIYKAGFDKEDMPWLSGVAGKGYQMEKGSAGVQVFDITGRTVVSELLSRNGTVQGLSNLQPGVYIMRVKTEAGTINRKVVHCH